MSQTKHDSSTGRRLLLAAVAIVAIAVALFGVYALLQGEPDSVEVHDEIRIGIATWPGFAPVFIAEERGFFGELDVTVEVLDDFSARQAAFTSGKTDFTIYTVDSLAFDAAAGVRGKIVMILDKSDGADGIVVTPEIKSLGQLKNARIAYTRGSPAHFLLYSALEKAALGTADIQTVEVDDPTRAAEAFLAGSVDAAVTWEPYLSQIRASGQGTVLEDTSTLDNRIVDVLVASEDVLASDPEVARIVVSGWLRALDEVASPKDDTFKIMANGLGMSLEDFHGAATGVAFADRDANVYWLVAGDGNMSRAQSLFEEASQVWIKAGFENLPTSGEKFVTSKYFGVE